MTFKRFLFFIKIKCLVIVCWNLTYLLYNYSLSFFRVNITTVLFFNILKYFFCKKIPLAAVPEAFELNYEFFKCFCDAIMVIIICNKIRFFLNIFNCIAHRNFLKARIFKHRNIITLITKDHDIFWTNL